MMMEISTFKYLGCSISCNQSNDVEIKLHRSHQILDTIKQMKLRKKKKR